MYSLKTNKGYRLEYFKKKKKGKKKINLGKVGKERTEKQNKNWRHIAKDSKVIELYPSYQLSFKIYGLILNTAVKR